MGRLFSCLVLHVTKQITVVEFTLLIRQGLCRCVCTFVDTKGNVQMFEHY